MQQAVTAKRFYLERRMESVIIGYGACLEVDRQMIGIMSGVMLEQSFDLIFAQNDRQNPVLEAIVVEDVGKGRGNDGTNAEIFDRPDRMFARGTAPEITTGDEDLGPLITGQIEFKHGIGVPIGIAPPIIEEERAESGSFDPFEKLFWDDLIGVDVRAVHGRRNAGQFLKWLHDID